MKKELNTNMQCGHHQTIGGRRFQEDEWLFQRGCSKWLPDVVVAGVFDGHAGGTTSRFLKHDVPNFLSRLRSLSDEHLTKMIASLDWKSCHHTGKHHSGSTLTMAFQDHETLTVVQVGDSGCIVLRPDGTFEDMAPAHKPFDWDESHRIIKAGGHVRGNRVDGRLAISRAIGDAQFKGDTTYKRTEQKVICTPTIKRTRIFHQDHVLLFSDGLLEKANLNEIANAMYVSIKEFRYSADEVCRTLNHISITAGSSDNHTTILLHFADKTNECPMRSSSVSSS